MSNHCRLFIENAKSVAKSQLSMGHDQLAVKRELARRVALYCKAWY